MLKQLYKIFCLGFFCLYFIPAQATTDPAALRQQVVVQQANIERQLIEAKNGVFILFTPNIGTPQMISLQGIIPEGLIPADKMPQYASTIQPRILTMHEMPANGIQCIWVRSHPHRARADKKDGFVDETHYQSLLANFSEKIVDKVIPPKQFDAFIDKGIPAAFYYYVPKGATKPTFVAIFAEQINAKAGSVKPGIFYDRAEDLKIVNEMLNAIGMPAVESFSVSENAHRCRCHEKRVG